MKKILSFLILVLLAATTAVAQPNNNKGEKPQFNPEEFKTMMRNYVRDKACLTQAEADKLFPIYFEMKTKQMEMNGKMMKLKRQKPDCNATTKEYSDLISQITELNVALAKLEQTYYAKMCKVVDAKKVYNVMCAEEEFHREMLLRANSMGRGSWNGNGRNGNNGRNAWNNGHHQRSKDAQGQPRGWGVPHEGTK